MSVDISSLSVSELDALQQEIAKTRADKEKAELRAVQEKIEEIIENSPFTRDQVLPSGKPKRTVKPKYFNPADKTQTWTGRGKRPLWYAEIVDNGGEPGVF